MPIMADDEIPPEWRQAFDQFALELSLRNYSLSEARVLTSGAVAFGAFVDELGYKLIPPGELPSTVDVMGL